ncbi:MAG: 23S rRNA (pseudouridine(1915)-N(3))-methyltransferase RlmH [Saprospiraceae bacterium]|nr:23S rRNA (pseudouridine(1915)-N(3))-methyltransferase RlmH [Saprospiraceae bacterium]
MKIEFWVIGKTNEKYLEEGIGIYLQRLRHYVPFEMIVISDVKNAGKINNERLKIKEAETVMNRLKKEDFLILLDEKGKMYTSETFAQFLEQKLQLPGKKLVFLVGGAYGFSEILYERADAQLSLSQMTFSHQMVRLFFVEQLYRAMTILRNEPYHNS